LQYKKLYRIYYTAFDDKINEIVVNELKEKYKTNINIIKSILVPEFRALELNLNKEGFSNEIKELVSSLTNSKYVRVDFIDTSI
jgi:hypothetical protein